MNSSEKNILKRNDVNFIFSFISREINILNDINTNIKERRDSIDNLYKFIVTDQPLIPSMIIQEIIISFNKNIIKFCLFDNIERVREFSLKILIHLYSNCTKLTIFFPFIFSALVDKLQCSDLEGVSDLPEDIRPTPSQKPNKIIKITETCEEIRILYVKLLETLICDNNEINTTEVKSNDEFRMFTQDIVNITRTLCMDPCPGVVYEACVFLKNLCRKFGKELLFYFNSILSRGIYHALTHRQSKLRLAAIDCLEELMYCSPYKKNVEIMEQLIGFRDPNLVPIKDFYESSFKLNYLALLNSDSSPAVIFRFYEMITNWMLTLEDRFDHEARLVPYLLSGLFDKREDICLYIFERIEMIGKLYESDNEKDIRENKQFAIDGEWIKYCTTINNKDGVFSIKFDKDLYYPFPISKRPCLGARLIVQKYLRRYIKNLCNEFEGVEEGIKIRVSNLVLFSIAYSEDGIVEFLDQILLCFQRELVRTLKKTNMSTIFESITKSLRLLGRFCDYESITNILYPTLLGDINGKYPEIHKGALLCIKYVIQGHLESVSVSHGLGVLENKIGKIIETLNVKSFIDYLDSSTASELIDFYLTLINLLSSKDSTVYVQIVEYLDIIFEHIVHALGALAIFDLHGVTNNELLIQIENNLEKINEYMMNIIKYSNHEKNNSFFALKIKTTLEDIDRFVESNHITINTRQFKIFFIFLKQIKIFMKNASNEEILEINKIILSVFSRIFNFSHNYPIHVDSIKMLSSYLNHSIIDINNNSFFLNSINNELVDLFCIILTPYKNIKNDDFKFADLLNEEKELEKKRSKMPKTAKSALRETTILLIKNLFNKNETFKISDKSSKNNSEVISKYIILFDEHLINEFIHEKESNRKLFSELYFLFLVKYFTINKIKLNLDKFDDNSQNILEIIKNFENYFSEEIFDSSLEVRQTTINVLNLIICLFEKSQFYNPMCEIFCDFNSQKDLGKFNFDSIKILAYVDEENKKIDKVFKSFKNIFSILINVYIDEKTSLGNLCEGVLKNMLEKFPIFCFNEFMRAKNKNQMTRIEILDKIFTKYLKI